MKALLEDQVHRLNDDARQLKAIKQQVREKPWLPVFLMSRLM